MLSVLIALSGLSFAVDTDHDGLQDDWELENGRDPLVADYQIEVAGDHTCAKHDNGVSCWGEDVYGETSAPPLSNPKFIETGDTFSCAVNSDAMTCWGNNAYIGGNYNYNVVYEISNISKLAIGFDHACYINDQGVSCFGDNRQGQTDAPALSNATDIVVGGYWSCALNDGQVSCWGLSQEHFGDIPALESPTAIFSAFNAICASENRGIVCWGPAYQDKTILEVQSKPYKIEGSYIGGMESWCSLDTSNFSCWGWNFEAIDLPTNIQLFISDNEIINFSQNGQDICFLTNDPQFHCFNSNSGAVKEVPTLSDVTHTSIGQRHVCVIDEKKVLCWGNNGDGQTDVPELSNPVAISSQINSNCAIDDSGVICWGNNNYGQLDPPNLDNPTQIALGGFHACALDDNGVTCWGSNQHGQSDVPTLSNPTAVSAGLDHTCAIDEKALVCWGDNSNRQLNNPELGELEKVVAGDDATCASDQDGLKCWGLKEYVDYDFLNPPEFNDLKDFDIALAVGCAVNGNQVSCWGDNRNVITTPPNLTLPSDVTVGSSLSKVACSNTKVGLICWGRADNDGQANVPHIHIDSDKDGYTNQNNKDVFPLDASEWSDYDGDGIGDNSDSDDSPPDLISISVDKTTIDVSLAPQTVTFTVEATDQSGINWSAGSNSTAIVMQDAGGGYHYALGNNDSPGKLSITVSSDDKTGSWRFSFLALTDNEGNRSLFSNSALQSFGLPASIETTGGIESDPPVLTEISMDKVSIDVSQSPQTITFTVQANDATGVDWGASAVTLRDQDRKYAYAVSTAETPGIFTLTIDSTDVRGTWDIKWLSIKDTLGNEKTYHYEPSLSSLGLPAFVYVLSSDENTSNIKMSTSSDITNVSENSEINYGLKIENLASSPTGELSFQLKSTNIRINSVSQAGSSACSISSINYNSTVSCALSGVDANASNILNLTLAPGISGTASFNASIVANIPDISYLNNYVSASLVVDPDGDGDGIAYNADNCPNDSNSDQLDTDSDGNGNACDIDDDNDTVLDVNDAFPLDATETIDTDSDGTGNNADTDDDGDGVIDSNDAYPLISLNGLTDTDLDGLPNDCDAACLNTGMTADLDDDGDGVSDDDDAFPLDSSEAVDSDLDGVGDNSDPFPNDALYSIDSDSDGMPDEWETRYGLDPNDASDAESDQDNDGVTALDEFLAGTIPSGSLDIDGNEKYDALTDGLLLLRGMFGLDGSALVTGTVASDATYTESVDIESRIATLGDLADIDGNGEIDALTDGLLTLRYLFGLQGDTLINGVVAGDATRKTAEEIEAYLETLMP